MLIKLKVWTWRGAASGAKHWMGSLESDKVGPLEIRRVLTPLIAATIGLPHPDLYEEAAGITNERFMSEQEVINYAKENFKTYFPDGTGLIYQGEEVK